MRTFKVSNDPHFTEKLIGVVGLYLNPPEHALVLSVDEKSRIQALDLTQPTLPDADTFTKLDELAKLSRKRTEPSVEKE